VWASTPESECCRDADETFPASSDAADVLGRKRAPGRTGLDSHHTTITWYVVHPGNDGDVAGSVSGLLDTDDGGHDGAIRGPNHLALPGNRAPTDAQAAHCCPCWYLCDGLSPCLDRLPIFGLAGLEGRFTTIAPPVASAAAAGVLGVAGFYQLTPLRARCLAACNQHLGAQAHFPSARSLLQTVRAGVAHGLNCLGACGGCMLILVAVGLMNIPWMIALTLIVWVEKVWRHGDHLALVVGLGLLLVGIFTAIDPQLILGW
jgi:hypothetical protein